MSAPIGNQFWKQRSKHGRDLIFASPTLLWEACTEYLEATDERKWVKKDWVGKDATEVLREIDTPYTLTGLFVFLDIDRKTWDLYRQREEFIPVTTRVEQIMYTQKFEGATVGAFNANIIARDLGLKDASEVVVNDQRKAVADLFPLDNEQNDSEQNPKTE
jgi:hypothetical protein